MTDYSEALMMAVAAAACSVATGKAWVKWLALVRQQVLVGRKVSVGEKVLSAVS